MSTRRERARNRARRARWRNAVYREPVIGRIEVAYFVLCPYSIHEVLLDRAYEYRGGRKSRAAQRRLEGNSREKLRLMHEFQRHSDLDMIVSAAS